LKLITGTAQETDGDSDRGTAMPSASLACIRVRS
jgi:hypothetical protein